MYNQDEVAHQQELLAAYRRTLNQCLVQAAQYGGEKFAPPIVANGIHEARVNIRRVKDILRAWDIPVEDLPDDQPITASSRADDAHCARSGVPAEMIQQTHPGEQASQPIPNPFVYGPTVSPERFYGRVQQRADIKGRIGGIAAQCISIVGMRRSGKSSLLRYIHERITEFCPDYQRPLPVLVDMQKKCCQTPLDLLERLRREIHRQTGRSPWRCDQNEDHWAVEEGLENLRNDGQRLIVLIDEFEQLRMRLSQFQDWGDDWRAKASAGLMAMVIATTRPLGEVYQACGLTSPFDNIFTSVILGALEPEEWRNLVRDGFEQGGRTISETDLALIEDLATGLPFYTQMAAAQLWQHNDSRWAKDSFVEQAEPRLTELWKDLPSAEQHAVRYIAGVKDLPPDERMRATLRKHGLLRPDGRLFSSAFIEFVRTQR